MIALRQAAGHIIRSGPSLGRQTDGAAAAFVLNMLVLVAFAAARWNAAHGQARQAAAAEATAQHLRNAYRAIAADLLTALCAQGEQLPASSRRNAAAIVSGVLPTSSAECRQSRAGRRSWRA